MDLTYIFAVMAFSAFLQTITSFGFALAAAPLLLFVMNPKEVVMFVLVTSCVNKLLLVHRTWGEGNFRSMAIIAAASLPGVLAGSYALKVANDASIKVLIGLSLLGATALMIKNATVTFRNKTLAQGIVGLVSGFLGSTTTFSGPPVMMYLMNEREDKDSVRANLARYFILGNLSSLGASFFFGTFQPMGMVSNLLISIPAIWLGFFIGDKLFSRLDAALFRKLAIGVIGISGLISVGSGIWPYLH